MEIDNVLRSIYYDQRNPSSYSTAKKLFIAAKEILPNIKINDVNNWLKGEFTYTLHKPLRKHFKRNPIVVEYKDQQWEADLVDLQEFKTKNKGYNFLLTVIDVFTKFTWAVPLKNKTAQSIVDAFKTIFDTNRIPLFIRTDQGKEFLNKEFKKLMKENKITHFTSINQDIKCAVIERFNRTLKGRMFKYFTAKGTRIWYNIIDDLVSAYNSTKHRTIKMTPNEALETDSKILFKNIYGVEDWNELYNKNKKKNNLKIGDTVRTKYKLGPFDKSYYPNWTDTLYKIETKTIQPVKQVFKIKDEKGVKSKQRYYPEEIQNVEENLYRVEKVLKERKYRGKKQFLVKWLNYPSNYNSWVNEEDIHKL